jgi:bifunctional non-homologous end joining protein LigD
LPALHQDENDLRGDTLEMRKATLSAILPRSSQGLQFNDHIEDGGATVFQHACELGLEGIVPKRKDLRYRSGRSPHRIKSKNPHAAAVKCEAEDG